MLKLSPIASTLAIRLSKALLNTSYILDREVVVEVCAQLLLTWLKLASLFPALRLWTFYTKSHNMKVLVILSPSWSPFLLLTCWYGKYELLWVSVWHSGVFSWEKTSPILPMQITWPWPPVGRYCHDQRICGHNIVRLVFIYILHSTCQWVHMALAINRPDLWCKIVMRNVYKIILV